MFPRPPPSATPEPPIATEAAPTGTRSSCAPAVPTLSRPPAQAVAADASRPRGRTSFTTNAFICRTLRPLEGFITRAISLRLEVVEPLLLNEHGYPVRLAPDAFHIEPPDVDPACNGEIALGIEIPVDRRDRLRVRGGRVAHERPYEVPAQVEEADRGFARCRDVRELEHPVELGQLVLRVRVVGVRNRQALLEVVPDHAARSGPHRGGAEFIHVRRREPLAEDADGGRQGEVAREVCVPQVEFESSQRLIRA